MQKFGTQHMLPFVFGLHLPKIGHKTPAVMKSTFRQCYPLSLNISKAVELKDKAERD